MPNWPDPSTSSENIWYTEAISYTGVIHTVNFPPLVETFELTFHAETVTSSLVFGKTAALPKCFSGIAKYATFTKCRSGTETKTPQPKNESAASPFVQRESFHWMFRRQAH